MKTKLYNLWYAVHSSYWFVPTLMTVGVVGLSLLTVWLDHTLDDNVLAQHWWLGQGGADGAREILSSIASSMITVAGVVFSVTIVALSLAAQQFGPRLLSNFMRDTGNQIVLGTFIATYVYCLLTLGVVRGEDGEGGGFVPHLSVICALLLALASLGVLIYFIHHVATSIQVTSIIAAVGRDLELAIRRLAEDVPPRQPGEAAAPDPADVAGPDFDREGEALGALSGGYLQAVQLDTLLALAARHELTLRLNRRAGHFLTQGDPVLHVWPRGRAADKVRRELLKAFIVGRQRTHEQDAEFAIEQLVEIALRALSPSLNDPMTATMCLDRLGAALSLLAQSPLPPRNHFDQQRRLRLAVAHTTTFDSLVKAAFDQIRQNGADKPAVAVHMLKIFENIALRLHDAEQREAIRRQARLLESQARRQIEEPEDLRAVEVQFKQTLQALETQPAIQTA